MLGLMHLAYWPQRAWFAPNGQLALQFIRATIPQAAVSDGSVDLEGYTLLDSGGCRKRAARTDKACLGGRRPSLDTGHPDFN